MSNTRLKDEGLAADTPGMGRGIGRRAIVVALALSTALAVVSPAPPALAGARKVARAQMVDLTNLARSRHNVRTLKLDKHVSHYAYRHAKKMASRQRLFHTAAFSPVLAGRHWHVAGENIGVGTSIDSVESAFLSSPEHRSNILDRSYRHVAAGVYTDKNGLVWITVIFYG